MDPTTAVRSDTLPAIGTVLAPGAFALTPYAWAMWTDPLSKFVVDHEVTTLTVGALAAIVVGLTIESLGSYVEYYCIDERRDDRDAMRETWEKYLRIAWIREPIGQHYLRRLLVSFKFELNLFVAAFTNVISLGGLAVYGALPWPHVVVAEVVLSCLALLFAKAAFDSSEVLAQVRATLIKGVGEPPFDAHGHPTRLDFGTSGAVLKER